MNENKKKIYVIFDSRKDINMLKKNDFLIFS